jgi:RNA polymerase primary sigma factor
MEDGENRDNPHDLLQAYLNEIRDIPVLSREEEIDYAWRIQQGDAEAERGLVLHNLKFVVHVAQRYKGCGLPLVDIINEGNIGLIQAAKRFDPDRGVKFITYAVWWIRQAITNALASQSRVVRLPVKQAGLISKIKSKHHELESELCREPSTQEIAEHLGIPQEHVESILRAYATHLPLDAPIRKDDELSYLNLLEDTNTPPVEDQFVRNVLAREVNSLLHNLPLREGKILRLRYGFDGKPHTLEEIGRKLNLSRERIRQIERKAEGRLKARIRMEALED